MKKHFPIFSLPVLCLCAAGLTFTACSDDDGDGTVPNAGVIPTVSEPITAIEDAWGGSYTYVYDEQGRLVGGNDFYGPFSVSFSPLSFTLTNPDDGYAEKWDNITTDTNGYMTSARISYSDEGGVVSSGNVRFSYDADGYLSRIEGRGSEDGVTFTMLYTFEYADGNLRRIVGEYKDPVYGDDRETYTFTYDAVGVNPNTGIPFYEQHLNWGDPYMFLGGYLGRPAANLPVACHETYATENEDGPDEYAYDFRYVTTYDAAGRVSSFTEMNEGGNVSWSYTYHYGDAGAEVAPSAVRAPQSAVAAGMKKRPASVRECLRARRVAWKR